MMSIKQLYQIFLKCGNICTDTRKIVNNSLFFAIHGENFNANQFAKTAIDNGCSYAVVDDEKFVLNEKFILVEDTLKTLQELAIYHRQQFKIPFIGITGTNGKTTTKELIAAVLSKKYNVLYTKGNLNNHIGVPLTILSVNQNTEIAVIEMGANHPGEIALLCKISHPDYGIITNIGKAHLEGFGSIEGVAKTKKELYDFIKNLQGKVFVCSDNEFLMNSSEKIERVTYGVSSESSCRGEIIESNPLLKVKWLNNNSSIEIPTNLFGFYNFENIMAAICIGSYFKVDEKNIVKAIEEYIPSNNRSQIIKTSSNTIIMDAYNANPTSMDASIKNFIHVDAENKFMIIGDMRELGNDALVEHEKILNLIESSGIKNVILVGNVFSSINKNNNIKAFVNSDEALEYLKKINPSNNYFLIKGSRGIKLEKVLEAL